MSYPEIIDEFDPHFPRDSYNREESFEIGRARKRSSKSRSKTKRRSFKMPMNNRQSMQSQNIANQNQSMTPYGQPGQQNQQPYGEPDYSYDDADIPYSSYDTHDDYDEDLGYDEVGRKHKSISAASQAEMLRKQREIDKRFGIKQSSIAVAKAVKSLKAKEAYRKKFEDKISSLEHEIERKDIDEDTRQQLEDQADEYEGMIADLKESQRQDLDVVRSNETEQRNPDFDPEFDITETDDMISGVAYIPSDDGLVVVGAEIPLAPIYAEVIGEFNNQVGLSFTGFFKKVGNVVKKIANNRIVKKLVSLAKGVASNPALASVVPGAGAALAAAKLGSGLVKSADAKNPKAVAIIQNVAANAKKGDPKAKAALKQLNAAAKIHSEEKMSRYARSETSTGKRFNWDDLYAMGARLGAKQSP